MKHHATHLFQRNLATFALEAKGSEKGVCMCLYCFLRSFCGLAEVQQRRLQGPTPREGDVPWEIPRF